MILALGAQSSLGNLKLRIDSYGNPDAEHMQIG